MSTSPATPTFGLICEGPSDYFIIQAVLADYFNDRDIDPNPLQPVLDATGKTQNAPGWTEVLQFCSSPKFAETFAYNKFVIIQIDTDVCEDKGFDVSRRDATGRELSDSELYDKVCAKLVSVIGQEVYEKHQDQILFAVCIHSIECWLLPFYFSDGRASKVVNCVQPLNSKLSSQEGFSIDENNKQVLYYKKILKLNGKKKGWLRKDGAKSPSLKRLIDQLDSKFPQAAPAGAPPTPMPPTSPPRESRAE